MHLCACKLNAIQFIGDCTESSEVLYSPVWEGSWDVVTYVGNAYMLA